MSKIKYVFLSGPYTKPNPNHNVRNTLVFADKLVAYGFVPFVPHLSHLWDTVLPHPYEHWMSLCLSWVERCDALLRLSGDSSGADREVMHAKEHGIPVFFNLEQLLEAANAQ